MSRAIVIAVWVALFGDIGLMFFSAAHVLMFSQDLTEQLVYFGFFCLAAVLGVAITMWLDSAESRL